MDDKKDRQKYKSLEKTLVLLIEEISNLSEHLKQQQNNVSSVSDEYIKEVEELLNYKDKQIQELEKYFKELDTQKL